MNTTVSAEQQHQINISKDFKATANEIFAAWTDSEMLRSWFGPEGVKTESVSVDFRVGGNYSFTMLLPDGQSVIHRGEYREIEKPNRLVFTWILEGQECEGSKEQYRETLVTLEFQEKENTTTLLLTHDFLPDTTSKEAHEFGWQGSLECLAKIL